MICARRAGLYAEYRLTGGLRHAETDLRHEPKPGRLHRRARRRPRLERAERRTVPVVVRPGGGDGPGAVRAQAVGDDVVAPPMSMGPPSATPTRSSPIRSWWAAARRSSRPWTPG